MSSEHTLPSDDSLWEGVPAKVEVTDELRARIEGTWLGRLSGWIVEYNGEQVAALSECRYQDMFWESYSVTALTENEDVISNLQGESGRDNLFNEPNVTFRNQEFPEIPLVGTPMVILKDGRAIVRFLYLDIGQNPVQITSEVATWKRAWNWFWGIN